MRKRIDLFGVLLVTSLFLLVGGASAQGDFSRSEQKWIGFIADAFEATRESESYYVQVRQIVSQTTTIGSGRSAVETVLAIDQTLDIEVENEDGEHNYHVDIEQFIETTLAGSTTEIELYVEIVVTDGEHYGRIVDASPTEIANAFPEDWIDINEDGDRYQFFGALALEDPDSLYNSPLAMPVDEDTIIAIEELDSEEIDDQEMRVYEVEYSAEAMLDSEAMQESIDAIAGTMPGIDVDNIVEELIEGTEMRFTVWIGDDDELVHRIDWVITIDATIELGRSEVSYEIEAESSAVFSEFGENFDIEAPDL